jgi:type IV secretion system protein VirB10
MTDAGLTGPETAAPNPTSGAGERTISPIAGRLGGRTGKAVTLAALAAGCGVFVLATQHHPRAKAAEPPAPARQVVPFEPAAPTLAQPGADAPKLSGDPPLDPKAASASANPSTAAQAAAAARAAPIVAWSRAGQTAPPTAPAGAGPFVPAILPRGGEPTPLDQLRHGSTLTMAQASRLPDRKWLILAGTSIPCTLQTAMDTATPGYVSCVIPTDVYSDNGAVVLLEKGTKVMGEYRGGPQQGQRRLFVLWTRAVTPAGVAIALASPASDALGRAGFDGDLDSHFMARFGGAILMSVLDDGFAAASRPTAGVSVSLPSSTANTALQSSLNIAPTLKKPAGAEVAIFAAQDLDFSPVYSVAAR